MTFFQLIIYIACTTCVIGEPSRVARVTTRRQRHCRRRPRKNNDRTRQHAVEIIWLVEMETLT